MNKDITMKEVLFRGEEYYGDEYINTWRDDFSLLERMTYNFKKEEIEKLYNMLNNNIGETMNMVQYIANNKN